MAGATLEFDSTEVLSAVRRALGVLENPQPMFADMGAYLLRSHDQRFRSQTAPDGTPWAPLSPRYRARKRKNRNRILFLDGFLSRTLRYLATSTELLLGSNRRYAALMHFGGEVRRAARQQELYFRQGRDGLVGNRFVRRSRSNFAQTVNVREHTVRYPARPFLGVSQQDEKALIDIALRHWGNAIK